MKTHVHHVVAGFTGADLQNLMNEAAILAARRNLQEISKEEISDALEKIIAGPEKKGAVVSDAKKKLVAYHEVHFLLEHICELLTDIQALYVTYLQLRSSNFQAFEHLTFRAFEQEVFIVSSIFARLAFPAPCFKLAEVHQ